MREGWLRARRIDKYESKHMNMHACPGIGVDGRSCVMSRHPAGAEGVVVCEAEEGSLDPAWCGARVWYRMS